MADVTTIHWYGRAGTVTLWRLLDLSGLTDNPRLSMNYLRSGFFYVDGARVTNARASTKLGESKTLELRFPNGVTKSIVARVVPKLRHARQRQNVVRTLYYRG